MAKLLPIEFHSDARAEADASFEYYLQRSPRAAEAFCRELENALRQIQVGLEKWPKYLHGTRRYLLKRFPFVIVYRLTEVRIEILAVAHGRRRPGYWADRLT
jgi:plasmid stabilization system protein ParE